MPDKGIMPILSKTQINTNNNADHYENLVERQAKT